MLSRRWRRFLLIILLPILGLLSVAFLSGVFLLRGSLARLDGDIRLEGLSAPVKIVRDSLGVPDIEAQSRLDAARALGYVHGQDRFFQMDMLRRNAAGELAALLGTALLETDRQTRRHRFGWRAREVVRTLSGEDLHLLMAYADGVNAGLEDLAVRPFEYLLLRCKPEYWQPEDTILALYSMFLDLSFSSVFEEKQLAMARDSLPPALFRFLTPQGNRWEAPLQDDPVPGVMIPDSSQVDVRRWTFMGVAHDPFPTFTDSVARHDRAGSNNWAIAGHLSGHGGALLANDMHLGLSLPNVWYRARLTWPEGAGSRTVVGVTLPGTPALVVGSNGRLAWGFTNSYGDWSDLVMLETDPADSTLYLTPDGWRETTLVREIIEVAGAGPDTLWLEETIWGPLWGTDTQGRRLALRWTPHDLETVNLNLRQLESADTVEEAVRLAGTIGIPQLNLVCADRSGSIAWTLAGSIPSRAGWDGRLPVTWARGDHRWDGYRDPRLQPSIIDPEEGRLWTANNRVAAGQDLAVIGNGGYALGARARQIRDHLRRLDRPVEADMLAVQLDDRALYLEEWRQLALGVLERHPADGDSLRSVFAEYLRNAWTGRAEISSVSYGLVRDFAWHCVDDIYDLLAAGVDQKHDDFRMWVFPHRPGLAWEVIQQKPPHLLHPRYRDYDDLVLRNIDAVMAPFASGKIRVEESTWGSRHVVRLEHPFLQLVPWLGRWLAAAPKALPGDSFMPRVQGIRNGASQRLVVSPGREERGILHLPGGQSGHPLSPYFLAGHEDWEQGKATPLLPGPPVHELVLQPGG